MEDFSKCTDENLKLWINGTNAEVDSICYRVAKEELYGRRIDRFLSIMEKLVEKPWNTFLLLFGATTLATILANLAFAIAKKFFNL